MDVILLQDIPKVGRKYEVKSVASGFAQNHLLPRQLAVVATPARIKELRARRAEAEHQHAQEYERIKSAFATLNGVSLIMSAKANEHGHLFQGIKSEDVAAHISSKMNITIHADQIDRQEPIKDIGSYEIGIAHDDLRATVLLTVEAA